MVDVTNWVALPKEWVWEGKGNRRGNTTWRSLVVAGKGREWWMLLGSVTKGVGLGREGKGNTTWRSLVVAVNALFMQESVILGLCQTQYLYGCEIVVV